jgi:REP element-mobilizing transposase RayT
MNDDLFKNKYRIPSARAYWHDYNHGCYFITICTQNREYFFGEILNSKMTLSEIGLFADSYVDKINALYDDAEILSHIVMPNHIHLIIRVTCTKCSNNDIIKDDTDINEKMSMIGKKRGRMSLILSKYKSSITRYALKNDIYFAWQSRFHDRIIRDYNEFKNINDYIKNNVINWKDDEYYPTITR